MASKRRFKQELRVNLMVMGQLADLMTTVYGMRHGNFREANPIMRYVINHTGLEGVAAFKLAFALAAGKRATPLTVGITWLPVINNLLL